jgi:hypothetical protein
LYPAPFASLTKDRFPSHHSAATIATGWSDQLAGRQMYALTIRAFSRRTPLRKFDLPFWFGPSSIAPNGLIESMPGAFVQLSARLA